MKCTKFTILEGLHCSSLPIYSVLFALCPGVEIKISTEINPNLATCTLSTGIHTIGIMTFFIHMYPTRGCPAQNYYIDNRCYKYLIYMYLKKTGLVDLRSRMEDNTLTLTNNIRWPKSHPIDSVDLIIHFPYPCLFNCNPEYSLISGWLVQVYK